MGSFLGGELARKQVKLLGRAATGQGGEGHSDQSLCN
jgi:hypothetical protein